jgi:hypothetical protein
MLRVLHGSLHASCSDLDSLPSRFHELVAELVAQDSVRDMKALLLDAAKPDEIKSDTTKQVLHDDSYLAVTNKCLCNGDDRTYAMMCRLMIDHHRRARVTK